MSSPCFKMKRKLLICIVSILALTYTTYYLYYQDFKPYDYRGMLQDLENGAALEDLTNKLTFVQNNENICERISSDASRLIVNVVVSARNHFEIRNAIRTTWGSRGNYGDWSLRIVFLIGLSSQTENRSVGARLDEEVNTSGDIVIGNFVDSYNNLTYKHLLSQHWISSYCSVAEAVVKSDDDVFLNIFKIVEFLNSRTSLSKDSGLIYCWVNRGGDPKRKKGGRWYVPESEYPFDVYPDYCNGAGYITTPTVMRKLFSVSGKFKLIDIEDAFGTGILRTHPEVRNEVKLENIGNRYSFYSEETLTFWRDELLFIILSGRRNDVHISMMQLWDKVNALNAAP